MSQIVLFTGAMHGRMGAVIRSKYLHLSGIAMFRTFTILLYIDVETTSG